MISLNIAVFVCTFKRPYELSRCVKSILEQELGEIEGINTWIIDNDPNRSAMGVFKNFRSNYDNVFYCNEPHTGVVFARNRALKIGIGENVDFAFFTDDDCIVAKNWVASAIKAIELSKANWVTGNMVEVKSYQFDNPPPSVFEVNVVPVREGATGNLALKSECFSRLKFDPMFNLIGSEDRHYTLSLSHNGFIGVKSPNMIVYEVEREGKQEYYSRVRRFRAGAIGTVLALWFSGWRFSAVTAIVTSVRFPLLFLVFFLGSFLPLKEELRAKLWLASSKNLGRTIGYMMLWRRNSARYFENE